VSLSVPRRHITVIIATLLVVSSAMAVGGCGTDQTGQPGVADADFRPRLVVTADDRGLQASVGERGQGDDRVAADPARLPAGSVLEIRFTGTGEQQVVGFLTPPGESPPDVGDRNVATPSPLVDTGGQQPGDTVTVVLAQPGTLRMYEVADRGAHLPVEITPRAEVSG